MAPFHENILECLMREPGAEIEPEAFEHQARILEKPSRVEAHLAIKKTTAIKAGRQEVTLAPGANILTDVSWKYAPAEFERPATAAGWESVKGWIDANRLST